MGKYYERIAYVDISYVSIIKNSVLCLVFCVINVDRLTYLSARFHDTLCAC